MLVPVPVVLSVVKLPAAAVVPPMTVPLIVPPIAVRVVIVNALSVLPVSAAFKFASETLLRSALASSKPPAGTRRLPRSRQRFPGLMARRLPQSPVIRSIVNR